MIRRNFVLVATAFTFLTRFPLVARWASGSASELAASARFFPVVGYAIGGIAAAIYYYAGYAFSLPMAALLCAIALPILTGCFHEDGLGDTADGLGGAFEPARKLEIMRDSRIGTYGTAALIALFLLRWQLFLELPLRIVFLVLISAHVIARWASVFMGWMMPYVREGAANKPVAEGIGGRELIIATAFACLWMFADWQLHAISMLIAMLIISFAGAFFRRQIGGVTGDTLGAATIVVEIGVLITWNIADRLGYWTQQIPTY